MPTPATQVAARMTKLATEFGSAGSTAVKTAAFEAKRIHVAELRRASGGDLRLSRVGKKGAQIGATFGVRNLSDGTSTALLRATGPVHFLEHVSQPHSIVPKGVGGTRRSRAGRRVGTEKHFDAVFAGRYSGSRPLRTPYGPRYRVQHPGVANPKKPWEKGFRRAAPMVNRRIRQQYGAAFARSAKGRL